MHNFIRVGLVVAAASFHTSLARADGVTPEPKAPDATPGDAPPTTTEAAAKGAPPPDRVKVGAFVDAYCAQSWKAPKPATRPTTFRAFDQYKGFNVAWIGLDASIDPEPVGFVGQLRFGSATPNLALADATGAAAGLAVVQQAYASYKPGGAKGRLTLIAGKFDTVYGHEVPQSQLNINYTRGVLFNLGQPFFHTGLRADYQATDQVVVKLLAVNGWNNSVDNNAGKSFGVSASFAPSDAAAVTVGYLGGPEQNDTVATAANPAATPPTPASTAAVPGAGGRLRHLADVVVDVRPIEPLRVVANGTFVREKTVRADGTTRSTGWYGAELLLRYALGERFGVGARGEYFVDDAHGGPTGGGFVGADGNAKRGTITTGTLTLEALPTKNMIVRLENRVDHASDKVFADGLSGASRQQVTTTVGVVVKSE